MTLIRLDRSGVKFFYPQNPEIGCRSDKLPIFAIGHMGCPRWRSVAAQEARSRSGGKNPDFKAKHRPCNNHSLVYARIEEVREQLIKHRFLSFRNPAAMLDWGL